MLEYLGEKEAAANLQTAAANIIAEGGVVTYDMNADRNDPTAVGVEWADAITAKLGG